MASHLTTALTRRLSDPFMPLCVQAAQAAIEHPPDAGQALDAPPNRFHASGVVARLALLAASVEIEETEPLEAGRVA